MAIFVLMVLTTLSSGADFYIKSLKAPLLEEAKNGSKTLVILERSTQVEGLQSQGSFVHVKTKEKQGFINKMFLSDKAIEGKNSLLGQDVDISSKARKRASGFTSAAAARGLKEDSDEVFKSLGDANFEDLKKMEALAVKENEAVNFLMDEALPLNKGSVK